MGLRNCRVKQRSEHTPQNQGPIWAQKANKGRLTTARPTRHGVKTWYTAAIGPLGRLRPVVTEHIGFYGQNCGQNGSKTAKIGLGLAQIVALTRQVRGWISGIGYNDIAMKRIHYNIAAVL